MFILHKIALVLFHYPFGVRIVGSLDSPFIIIKISENTPSLFPHSVALQSYI